MRRGDRRSRISGHVDTPQPVWAMLSRGGNQRRVNPAVRIHGSLYLRRHRPGLSLVASQAEWLLILPHDDAR